MRALIQPNISNKLFFSFGVNALILSLFSFSICSESILKGLIDLGSIHLYIINKKTRASIVY